MVCDHIFECTVFKSIYTETFNLLVNDSFGFFLEKGKIHDMMKEANTNENHSRKILTNSLKTIFW